MLGSLLLRLPLAIAVALTAAPPPPLAQTLGTPLGVFAETDRTQFPLALSNGTVLIGEGGTVNAYDSEGSPLGFFSFGLPLTQLADDRVLIARGLSSNQVHAHQPDGTYIGLFVAGLNEPWDATQLADGRVLIAEYGTTGDGRVSRFDPDGTPRGAFAPDATRPTSVLALADGRVLVGETGRAQISIFEAGGTRLGVFHSRGGFFGDIAQLPDGRILTAGFGVQGLPTGEVLAFAPDGTYLGPFTDNRHQPFNLALHPDGRVLVVDRADGIVYAYAVAPPVASEPVLEVGATVTAVHPSPVHAGETARLLVTLAEPGEVTVSVHDATGREFSRKALSLSAVEGAVEVATRGLAAGVYAVRVVGPGVEATRRLVVVR